MRKPPVTCSANIIGVGSTMTDMSKSSSNSVLRPMGQGVRSSGGKTVVHGHMILPGLGRLKLPDSGSEVSRQHPAHAGGLHHLDRLFLRHGGRKDRVRLRPEYALLGIGCGGAGCRKQCLAFTFNILSLANPVTFGFFCGRNS